MHESLIAEIYLYVDDLVNNKVNAEKDFYNAVDGFKRNLLNLYKSWGYKCQICKIDSLIENKFYKSYIVMFTDKGVIEANHCDSFMLLNRLVPEGCSLPCKVHVTVK